MEALTVDVKLTCPIKQSPRLLQMSSLFDVPPCEHAVKQWTAVFPLHERPWHVGLIVGPSGAGKSSVARALFPDHLVPDYAWSRDSSLLEDFPQAMSTKAVVELLTSVGFSSPPAWMRPFHTLSTGEQFRVTMARALAEAPGLVVVDEFTSVVDRQVAQVASHVLQKAIRRQGRQFVAVSCHSDILAWLQPDWVYQPELNRFQWRDLQGPDAQRPPLVFSVHPVDKAVWPLFAHHHYLSKDLHVAAKCFGAFVGEQCVAFTSYRPFPHPKTRNIMQGHRLVVLPDWQGLGLGGRLDDWLGQYLYERGYRYHNVVAHPAMVAAYSKSPRWELVFHGRMNTGGKVLKGPKAKALKAMRQHQFEFSATRHSYTFVYRPPAI
jgi:GNAT superfamily N-acetyltransferase